MWWLVPVPAPTLIVALMALEVSNLRPASATRHFVSAPGELMNSFITPGDSKGLRCLSKSCPNGYCVFAYNPFLGICHQATLSSILRYWYPHKYGVIRVLAHTITIRNRWLVLLSSSKQFPRPAALWLFNSFTQGNNWGTKHGLDSPVKFMHFYHNKNPRESYAGSHAYTQRVLNKKGGKPILDFTGPFSIVAWVQTTDYKDQMPIIDSYPKGAVDFWFWPSKDKNQLHLGINHDRNFTYMSTVSNRGLYSWRHIAVTYDPSAHWVAFYLNGFAWQTKTQAAGAAAGAINPEDICFWGTCDVFDDYYFRGNVSCLAVYEQVLSANSIRILKNECP